MLTIERSLFFVLDVCPDVDIGDTFTVALISDNAQSFSCR
jgi:hypothetical protein